jgi:hypothetical protein
MKSYPVLLLTAALIAGGCQSTSTSSNHATPGDVTVNFQDPDKFDDVRETFAGGPSQYYLDVLSKHLKEVAARHLAPGQKLTVTFTNIDLAGDFIPGGRPERNDIRIIKDIYIPRMSLTFQLKDANGTVIKEGERKLSDLNFQNNISIIGRNEPLNYDKDLLDRWVEKEFRS